MLETSDIVKTVDYLLSLSKNALSTEVVITNLSFIEKSTKATYQAYGLK